MSGCRAVGLPASLSHWPAPCRRPPSFLILATILKVWPSALITSAERFNEEQHRRHDETAECLANLEKAIATQTRPMPNQVDMQTQLINTCSAGTISKMLGRFGLQRTGNKNANAGQLAKSLAPDALLACMQENQGAPAPPATASVEKPVQHEHKAAEKTKRRGEKRRTSVTLRTVRFCFVPSLHRSSFSA